MDKKPVNLAYQRVVRDGANAYKALRAADPGMARLEDQIGSISQKLKPLIGALIAAQTAYHDYIAADDRIDATDPKGLITEEGIETLRLLTDEIDQPGLHGWNFSAYEIVAVYQLVELFLDACLDTPQRAE